MEPKQGSLSLYQNPEVLAHRVPLLQSFGHREVKDSFHFELLLKIGFLLVAFIPQLEGYQAGLPGPQTLFASVKNRAPEPGPGSRRSFRLQHSAAWRHFSAPFPCSLFKTACRECRN